MAKGKYRHKSSRDRTKIRNENVVLSTGYKFLIAAVIISGLFFLVKGRTNLQNGLSKNNQGTLAPAGTGKKYSEADVWIPYERRELGFSMKYPSSLYLNDMAPHGEYYDFIRFEEGEKSRHKGISLGISQSNLKVEVERIKRDFENQEAKLVEEKDVIFKGFTAKRLHYVPIEIQNGEERLVVVIANNNYVYSISSVPDQMNEIIKNFNFLNTSPTVTPTPKSP